MNWLQHLPQDPIPSLLASPSEALRYMTKRDLLDESVSPITQVWDSAEVQGILRKQQENGSWRYSGKVEPYNNYGLLETFRNLRLLVEMYELSRAHPAIERAAEYLFSCQTVEGDLRGILGNQYIPYYHGAIVALLIKAGYQEDARVAKALAWLLSMRQDDGGWIVPAQAVPPQEKTEKLWRGHPVPPDRSRPFSHLATGMVLRAFAAHSNYRGHPAVQTAAALLKGRFLRSDKYNDRKTAAYWTKFQFPYWWVDLISGLDIMSRLGFSSDDEDITCALQWFESNQEGDGLWPTGYGKGVKAQEARAWVGLAACRVLRDLLK